MTWFKSTVVLYTIVGIMPWSPRYERFRGRVVLFNITMILALVFAMSHYILFDSKNKQSADFMVCFVGGIFRYTFSYLHCAQHVELVNFINDNFVAGSDDHECNMRVAIRECKKYKLFYATTWVVWDALLWIAPGVLYLLSDEELFPIILPASYLFDTNTNFMRAIVYVLQFVGCNLNLFSYMFTDLFWFTVAYLTIAQFDIVRCQLQEIAEKGDDSKVEDMIGLTNICVDQHAKLRKLVIMIDKLIGPIMIAEFLLCGVCLSFMLFEISLSIEHKDWIQVLKILSFFVLTTSHLFMISYLGSELTYKAQLLQDAVYNIPWYNHLKESKNLMMIMTIVSSNPGSISAMSLFKINLNLFMSTMKLVWSYLTILIQFQEVDNK